MPDTRLHLEQLLWAMRPSFLAQVTEKMERLAWSDEPQAKPTESPKSILTVNDGIGIIPVSGMLMSENHWLFGWVGDTAYEAIQRAAKEAQDRADVHTALIRTDSGGGLLTGAQETSEAIRRLAQVKPVIGHNENQMSSAAYWTNTHVTHLVSAPAGLSGSVGVATIHREISALEKKIGIKTTDIASGDRKRVASMFEPLSDDAKAYLTNICQESAKVFVDDVTSARKLTNEQKAEVARAGEFVGAQAVSVGLVDSLGLSAHVTGLLNLYKEKPSPAVFDLGRNSNGGINVATPEELKAARDDERKRIQGIKAKAPAGMEAFAEALAYSDEGLTVEQAASRILDEMIKNPPKPKEEPPAAVTPAAPAAAAAEGLNKFMGEAPPPLVVATKETAPEAKNEGVDLMVAAATRRNEEQRARMGKQATR